MENARIYCRYVAKEFGAIPVAPHIYFTQFLDDGIAEERAFGLRAGLSLLSGCDELWYPERGTCLFKCGNERYLLQVNAPEYKAKLFGNAGGR